MTKGKCVICGTKFTSKARNAKTCSPECREEKNRRRARNRYREHNDVDLNRPRFCYLCGADITDLPLRAVICKAPGCKRKHKYEIEKKCRKRDKTIPKVKKVAPPIIRIVKTVKVEKKGPNQCTIPGCKSDRGPNRQVCGYHLKMRTASAGRCDGDWAWGSSLGIVRQRKSGGGMGL